MKVINKISNDVRQEEARLMLTVKHPNVIYVEEFFSFDKFQKMAIIMELADYNLASKFTRGLLKIDR